jgi:hypothetical protein
MFDFFGEINRDYGCCALIIAIVLILGLVFGLLCLEAWVAMSLWNGCAVPAVSVLSEVSFWQMWGISLLCNILFKSYHSSSKSK